MIRYTALNLVGCKKFFSLGMQFSKLLYGINTDYLHVKETLNGNLHKKIDQVSFFGLFANHYCIRFSIKTLKQSSNCESRKYIERLLYFR